MDTLLDARFDRVEKALATLIDSIAKYNPSTALAEDLLAADKELSRGLEELQTHQNNFQRILALRAQAAAFDGQIKSTLLSLAASRKEMLATPATVFPEDDTNWARRRRTGKNYDFTYEQLMSYARRISRNTIPAAGQTDGSDIFGFVNGGAAAETTAPATGATTPAAAAAATAAASASQASHMDVDTAGTGGAVATPSSTAGAANATGPAGTAAGTPAAIFSLAPATNVPNVLPQDYQQYISPMAGTMFFPWPMPDLMQHGALRAMQAAADADDEAASKGQAAATRAHSGKSARRRRIRFVSLEEQQELERQQAAREAEEREQREERQRRMANEAAEAAEAAAAAARPSGPRPGGLSGGGGGSAGRGGYAPSSAAPAPAQFSSTLDMDDD